MTALEQQGQKILPLINERLLPKPVYRSDGKVVYRWSDFNPQQKIESFFLYKKDLLLFIMECIKIPLPGASESFEPYNRQVDVLDAFLDYHYLVVLKSRQIGISTIVQALIVALCVLYDNYIVGVLSRDKDEAVDFCKKIKDMISDLPSWVRPDFVKKREKSFILENKSAVYAETVNPARPQKVFRGKSLSLLVIDEAAHIAYIDKAFTGIAPTLSATHKACKKKGIPYGCVVMSTPNGTIGDGKWFYDLWMDALSGSTKFKHVYIHYSSIPAFRNDPQWYKDQCEILREQWQIDQELECKFIAPHGAVFSGDIASKLQNQAKKPVLEETVIGSKLIDYMPNGEIPSSQIVYNPTDMDELEGPVGTIWYWYTKEEINDLFVNKESPNYIKNSKIVVSVDSATMFGTDKSVIEVHDIVHMDQIAEFGGKCRVDTLIDILENTIMPLFPNALLVIEVNNPGNQLIEHFTKHSKWSGNLYKRSVRDDKNGYRVKYRKPGFATTAQTRPLLIDALYTIVTELSDNLKSERLLNQLITLKRTSSGRIEGNPHDDYAIALALACYIRQYEMDIAFDGVLLPDNQVDNLVSIIAENSDEPTSIEELVASQPIKNKQELNRTIESPNSYQIIPTVPEHYKDNIAIQALLNSVSGDNPMKHLSNKVRRNPVKSDPMDDLDLSSWFEEI